MGINFNIVKKPKVEEDDGEELEEETVEVVDDKSSSSGYDPKKKMIKFMGIIVLVMLVLLVILFLFSSGRGRKSTYSYSEIETILEKAGKAYFKEHSSYLPEDEGDIAEVEVSTLVADGKMKDLSEYPTKDGATCIGSVKVQLVDEDYLYSPVLNCGDKYATIAFSTKIVDDSETVTTGDGLYSRNGEYIFRGENVNNYVQLDNSLWRIVKITTDDEVVLISANGVGFSTSWDDRYNEDKKYAIGINNYSVSRVKDYLDDVYKGNSKNKKDKILSSKDKTRMVTYNVCVGKKSSTSEDKKNAEECKQLLKDQKLGLLTLSDYMYASVDPNCKSADTKSCANYNYLVTKYNWWLATANNANTYQVYRVRSGGLITADNASTYSIVRPVIHLNSSVMYKSGKGTEEKPYTVR